MTIVHQLMIRTSAPRRKNKHKNHPMGWTKIVRLFFWGTLYLITDLSLWHFNQWSTDPGISTNSNWNLIWTNKRDLTLPLSPLLMNNLYHLHNIGQRVTLKLVANELIRCLSVRLLGHRSSQRRHLLPQLCQDLLKINNYREKLIQDWLDL